jgi:hypothetical protein
MPDTQVVRLRDPAELIAAIPYLIGFHPSDCFVVCGLAAESPVLHMRVDADAGSQPAALARMFASHLQRARAESLILVGYGATAAGTISQVADAMHSGPLVVLDVLTVLDGRWRSLLCESAACCPPGGSPIPVAEQLPVVAQLVAAGRVARRDRSELICDVEADAKRQTDVAAHIVRIAELTPLPAAGLLQQWLDVGTAIGAGSELPSASVSAQLLHGLRNVRVRDDLMGEIARDPIGLEPLLTWLASSCPTHEAAPIFTLTALPAWLRGDGARASQLLELALNADPDYRLAQLLDLGLSAGLPPAEIAAICRSAGAGAGADEDAPAAAS